jgi:hypothetical protein
MVIACLGGCVEPNAVLELRLDLPAASDASRPYAFTQVRRDDATSFDALWGDSSELLGSALSTTERSMDHISVESLGGDDDFDVKIRVRFCTDAACSTLEDDLTMAPRSCFVVRHPFYVGRRTELDLRIENVPSGTCGGSDVTEIARCSVRGCAGGDTTMMYCREDGTHFCEE